MNTNKEQESASSRQFPIGKVVEKRWRIAALLGKGACGTVYRVEDRTRPGFSAALKVEFDSSDYDRTLHLEVNVLNALKNRENVLKMWSHGRRKTYTYVVTSLCGKDLIALRSKIRRGFNDSTALRVSVFMLYGLKQLHEAGFVHRDVKPGNMMTASGGHGRDARLVILIDFGMARSIVVEGDRGVVKLRPARKRILLRGTERYCSVSVHERHEQGRHDDLIAMVHSVVAVTTELPWQALRGEREVVAAKRATTTAVLFEDLPEELKSIYEYLSTLTYSDRPNYEKVYNLLMSAISRLKINFLDAFEWEDEEMERMDREEKEEKERMKQGQTGSESPVVQTIESEEPTERRRRERLNTAIDYEQSEWDTKKALPREQLQFHVYPLLAAKNFAETILPF